jgi:hypothetical protein
VRKRNEAGIAHTQETESPLYEGKQNRAERNCSYQAGVAQVSNHRRVHGCDYRYREVGNDGRLR